MDIKEYSEETTSLRKMMDMLGLTVTGTMSFPISAKPTCIHIWILDGSLETVYRKTTKAPKITGLKPDYNEALDAYLEAIEDVLKYKKY